MEIKSAVLKPIYIIKLHAKNAASKLHKLAQMLGHLLKLVFRCLQPSEAM